MASPRLSARIAAPLVALLACHRGGGDGGAASAPDAAVDAPVLDCRGLVAMWPDLVASLDRTCSHDGHCAYVGAHIADRIPTCDCMPWLRPAAVTRGDHPDVDAFIARVLATCDGPTSPGLPSRCDAAPPRPYCSEGGYCAIEERSCLSSPLTPASDH